MIKRIIIPELKTLEEYCDKNDLTIILTSYRSRKGKKFIKAEINVSHINVSSKKEKVVLIKLAKLLSGETTIVNNELRRFPILRCY